MERINSAAQAELEKLGIYELRSLARQLGVKSPTTKKRGELLESIKAIITGEMAPQTGSRAGRPAKKMYDTENLLSNFFSKADEELKNKIKSLNKNFLKVEFNRDKIAEEIAAANENKISIKVSGVMRKTTDGSWFFLSDGISAKKLYVIVQESIVKEYNLIEGDMVFGGADLVTDKNFAVLVYIDTINGGSTQNLEFTEIPNYQLPEEKFLDYPINKGQCFVEKTDNNKDFIAEIEERAKYLTEQGYECLCLAVELSIEKRLKLDKVPNLKKIYTMYDDNSILSYEAIIDTICHSKALFHRNKKVVLFVVDLFSLSSVLDLYFSSKGSSLSMGHTIETVQALRTLLGASRVSDKAELTIVANYLSEEATEHDKDIKDIKKYAKVG